MPQANTNPTFKQTGLAETTGSSALPRELTVQFRTADPAAPELAAIGPYIWVNTTTGLLKFSPNGVDVETVTST